MPKGHKLITPSPPSAMPESSSNDCRDGIHWFIDNAGLYIGSTRGLFATDFADEQEAVLEAAIINLKARNVNPVIITGEMLYKQADFLWASALEQTTFGRPVASKLELDISGSEFVIVKDLEAPEAAHHLWYLFHHLFYPRALFNKPILLTSPLGYDEFVTYGAGCDDLEFAGRKVTWEKLLWTINATTMDLPHFRKLKADGIPPMLKAEFVLFKALKERGLEVVPQHVIGDYMLDFALIDKQNKIDIEVDIFASIDHNKPSTQEVKRNLQLLNDGWKIVKFSTAEILHNPASCVDTVEEVWQQGRKKSPSGRVVSGTQPTTVPDMPVDDDAQKFAITHGAGPAAVEGGSGTGKSSCVAHRVAYLLAQGISPEKILVITHSPECVKQLKATLEASADRTLAQRVPLFCWHDLGLKLLKENLSAIKRKPPVKVESNPQKSLKRLLDKFKKDLDPTLLELSEELDEYTLASLVSLYKANLVSPRHVKERAKTEVDELVAKVYQAYEDQLQKANRVDRDDMISLAAQLLVDDAEVRAKHQYQYEFVLVDEYQDATAAGDLLARLLAFPQDNVYLVGNEDESIFETKGSLPRLMSEVSIRLPNARCYMLEKNWRSHPVIVDHARQLLNGLSRRRIQKDMVSGYGAAPSGAVIGPHVCDNEMAEAEWVADEIEILIDSGRTAQEVAIIYHENRYATLLEESISRRGIRCLTSNSQSAMLPDEVGDVMAFLTLVMDPDGPKARESFERICHLRVKEVNPALSATIASFAESNNLSYLKGIEIYWQAVQDPSCRELEQLVRIIRTMHQEKLPPAETISLLKRTQRLSEYYSSIKVPPGAVYEPMRKLGILEEEARKFQSVTEFVKSQLAIQQAANGQGAAEKAVHVLSIHESKGREFPVAFIVGMSQGLMPAAGADLEEERRLFYVAFTRAKELVYLSYPTLYSNEAVSPSGFLIDARLMLPPAMRQMQSAPQLSQSGIQQTGATNAGGGIGLSSTAGGAPVNSGNDLPSTNFAPGAGRPGGQTGQYPAMQPQQGRPQQGMQQTGQHPSMNPAAQQTGRHPAMNPAVPQTGQQSSMNQSVQQTGRHPAMNPAQQTAMNPTAQPAGQQPGMNAAGQQTGRHPAMNPVANQTGQHPAMNQAAPNTGQFPAMNPAANQTGQHTAMNPAAQQNFRPTSQASQQQIPAMQPQNNQQVQHTQQMPAMQPQNNQTIQHTQQMQAQMPGQAAQQMPAAQTRVAPDGPFPASVSAQGAQTMGATQQSNTSALQAASSPSASASVGAQPAVQSANARTPLPSNAVPSNVLPGNATPANTSPGSLAPRAIKPVAGGPNTPDHYPVQPVSRGAAQRETAALNVSQLPSPEELQAKIAAEAALLTSSRPAETRRNNESDMSAPGQQANSISQGLPVSKAPTAAFKDPRIGGMLPPAMSQEQSVLLDGLFAGAESPTETATSASLKSGAEDETPDQDFPSTGPTRKAEDLTPATVKKGKSQAAQPALSAEEEPPTVVAPPEHLVQGFQSALAQAGMALQQQAAQPSITHPSIAQPVDGSALPAAQPGQPVQANDDAQPVQMPAGNQPPQNISSPAPFTNQTIAPEHAIAPKPFGAPQQERTWESPWEKEKQAQQAQHHPHRSIPVTPPSVLGPAPDPNFINGHSEPPLGELDLNQFAEEHNYDVTPPTRADMHGMHGEYHPNSAKPAAQKTARNESGISISDEDSDIADLLELAAKAPSKKGKNSKAPAKAAPPVADDFEDDIPLQGLAAQSKNLSGASQGEPVPYLDQEFVPQLPVAPADYQQPRTPTTPVPMSPAAMAPIPQQPWTEQVKQLQQGALYSPPEFTDHHPRCPHCYVMLEGGSRFCGECGYTLPERIPVCQKCSSTLEPGAKFCGECGSKQVNLKAPGAVASSIGVTQAELATVPQEALSNTENFKKWVNALNPQGQQTWMVKLLKLLEQ